MDDGIKETANEIAPQLTNLDEIVHLDPEPHTNDQPTTSAKPDLIEQEQQQNAKHNTTTTTDKPRQNNLYKFYIRKKGINLFYERLNTILLLVIIPLALVTCIVLKISFTSIIYLLLLFFLPFFYPINATTIAQRLLKFLIVLTTASSLNLLAQFVFQIVLLSNQPYANNRILPNCSLKQEILEEFTLSRWDKAYLVDIFRLIVPDVLLLLFSIFSIILCRKIHKTNLEIKRKIIYSQNEIVTRDTTFTGHFCPLTNLEPELNSSVMTGQIVTDENSMNSRKASSETNVNQFISSTSKKILPFELRAIIDICTEIVFLALLFLCSSMWPSVLSIFYFLSFLFLLTKWSLVCKSNTQTRKFLKLVLIVYTALHLLTYYLYQIYLFQYLIDSTSLYARLFGLNKIVYTKCDQPAHFYFASDFKWQQVLYPFMLLLLYWMLAVQFSYKNDSSSDLKITSLNVNEFLYNNSKTENTASKLTNVKDEKENTDDDELGVSKEVEEKKVNFNDISDMSTLFYSINNSDKKFVFEYYKLRDDSSDSYSLHELHEESKSPKHLFATTTPASARASREILTKDHRPSTDLKLKFASRVLSQSSLFLNGIYPSYLKSLIKFLEKQSYLLSLIAMMTWSILYHSILTLVLLLWACLIWVLPKSRKWCLKTSPLFVSYTIILTCLEFAYGLQLRSDELPEYEEIGLVRHKVPFFDLAKKTGLMLTFWLTLRQYISEKRNSQSLQSNQSGIDYNPIMASELTFHSSSTSSKLMSFVYVCLVKYWIFLSSGMLLLMSCQTPVVAYRIVYMLLFLYFITAFQVLYRFWRKTLFIFHLVVVIYSMFVLLLLYVFQFKEVPNWFKNKFHVDDKFLSSFGFEFFGSKEELAYRLLTPTTFLIVNILQIHYFNSLWLKVTDDQMITPLIMDYSNCERKKDSKSKEEFRAFVKRCICTVNKIYVRICVYLWRAVEIHTFKILLVVIGMYTIQKVTLVNLLLFLGLISYLIIEKMRCSIKKIQSIYCGMFQLYISLLTILSMIYNMPSIDLPITHNCTFDNQSVVDPYLLKPHNISDYIGIEKYDYNYSILENLKYYIVILSLLTFRKIVVLKQRRYRKIHGTSEPIYSVIFENITVKDMDTNFKEFLQYMVNFFFFRFGVEVCFFMSAIAIAVRMDFFSIIYGIWLGVFVRIKRENIAKIWTIYWGFLVFAIVLQYISCLGLPPFLCLNYPWINEINNERFNLFKAWLFLPNYDPKPLSTLLIVDFLQLFFVWHQYFVFKIEAESSSPILEMSGSNKEIVHDPVLYASNPYHDFVSDCRNTFDVFKYGIFMYSYWFVLALIYITGTSRISLLCLGYVILSFFFLWYGQTFLIKPIGKLLRLWNVLIFYCFIVIFIKACLQFFLRLSTNTVSQSIIKLLIDPHENSDKVGLGWDVTCFIVLLIQKRIYCSYMFIFVVNENRAQSFLAARGAQIFKDIIQMRVKKEKLKDSKELEILKKRVERIRQKRTKLNQAKGITQETNEYYDAIRSGDYYMFEAEFETSDSDRSDSEDETRESFKRKEDASKKYDSTDDAGPKTSLGLSVEASNNVFKKQTSLKLKLKHEKIDEINEISKVETKASQTNTAANVDDTIEIKEEADDSEIKRESWLTIENQTTLQILSAAKKSFILIDYLIEYFNRHSKDFRIVSHILSKEKITLKREYSQKTIHNAASTTSNQLDQTTKLRRPFSYELLDSEDNIKIINEASNEIDCIFNSLTRVKKILISIFYLLISQSELICYFFMILNHINSASLLSITLPISVFLWAMLCIPRPTKTYWITIITYVEVIVVVKFIFQFDFFPWNGDKYLPGSSLLRALEFLGIENVKKDIQFAIYDLFVLLAVFIHRTILKKMGLWRDSSADDDDLLASNDEKDSKSKSPEENPDDLSDEIELETRKANNSRLNHSANNNNNKRMIEFIQDDSDSNTSDADRNNQEDTGAKRTQIKSEFACIRFYQELSSKCYAVVVDCYAKMFLCDFINCIITIFTYQYFGEAASMIAEDSSNVVNSIKDNKVPYTFLMMFLIQFVLMIIDRSLYLRKNRTGKLVFQAILVISVHVWLFFVLPFITKLKFVDNTAVQIWYFVKCIYFAYSSRQIRCGYPKRILGNFLTKSYSYVNLVLFKGFLIIPFLLEIRSLMDWMFTDSSFGLTDWIQMEDIYANIFVLKCNRNYEKKYPTPRGTKRKPIIKYSFGGFLLMVIIFTIWFPLLLFSVSDGFNRSVPPTTCKINVQIAGYLPIYSMTSQLRSSSSFTKENLDDLKKEFKDAYGFMEDFNPQDVYCISIPGNSTSLWEISPPSLNNLKEHLKTNDTTSLDFMYWITRESSGEKNEQLSEIVSGVRQKDLENDTKSSILKMLINNTGDDDLIIPAVYPRFVHARSKGNIIEIDSFRLMKKEGFNYYVNATFSFKNQSNVAWWNVYDQESSPKYKPPCFKSGNLNFVIFSDKVFPSSLSFLTERGIIGIYITFVLAISRFIRIMVVNSSMKIMFEQLPNVDRILKLCDSLYMVRENKKFILEEEIFAKIIFLYRSTETMIKYTKKSEKKTLLDKKNQ